MLRATLLLSTASTVSSTAMQYAATATHSGSSFWDGFTFFTGTDPNSDPSQSSPSLSNFVGQSEATQAGILGTRWGGRAYASVDNATAVSSTRSSLRFHSNVAYDSGLFVLNLTHMPYGCSLWPAFWFLGSMGQSQPWPYHGEIDVIEGINQYNFASTSIHTTNSPGCTMNSPGQGQTGSWDTTNGDTPNNCYTNYASNMQGCKVMYGPLPASNATAKSYGSQFNANGGGVYAIEIASGGIKVWFFPRGDPSTPTDLLSPSDGGLGSTHPDPLSWVEPYAYFPFGSSCQSSNFATLRIIFDITVCGSWAGGSFGNWVPTGVASCADKDGVCSAAGISTTGGGCCAQYARTQPRAFDEAYWLIDSLVVYELREASPSPPPTPPATPFPRPPAPPSQPPPPPPPPPPTPSPPPPSLPPPDTPSKPPPPTRQQPIAPPPVPPGSTPGGQAPPPAYSEVVHVSLIIGSTVEAFTLVRDSFKAHLAALCGVPTDAIISLTVAPGSIQLNATIATVGAAAAARISATLAGMSVAQLEAALDVTIESVSPPTFEPYEPPPAAVPSPSGASGRVAAVAIALFVLIVGACVLQWWRQQRRLNEALIKSVAMEATDRQSRRFLHEAPGSSKAKALPKSSDDVELTSHHRTDEAEGGKAAEEVLGSGSSWQTLSVSSAPPTLPYRREGIDAAVVEQATRVALQELGTNVTLRVLREHVEAQLGTPLLEWKGEIKATAAMVSKERSAIVVAAAI